MKKKIIFLVILIISGLIILSACDKKNDDTVDDNVDMNLINKVSARFDEIFLAFNEKRFDDYVAYYRIDDEQKNMILTGLNESLEYDYDTKYEIRNVLAFPAGDDGLISATILYYAITTSGGESFIVEDTMYYKLAEENGSLFISSYESGPQRVIE